MFLGSLVYSPLFNIFTKRIKQLLSNYEAFLY